MKSARANPVLTAVTCCLFTVVFSLPCLGFEEEPRPRDAEEWRAGEAITITFNFPAAGAYVSVNGNVLCGATVEDKDEFRIGSDWFTAYDDVTSGNTAQNHHITWEATEGTFPNPYGTPRSYYAPTYDGEAPDVRQDTITCSADDHGAPDYYDDASLGVATRTINLWQVRIEKRQSGQISPYNDMEGDSGEEPYVQNKPAKGGSTLGWVEWHNPVDCIWYSGNTELKGPIPQAVPNVDGFMWLQWITGEATKQKPGEEPKYIAGHHEHYPDFPPSSWQDGDSRHPNLGTDVNEVFMYDNPGFNGGPQNNNQIGAGYRHVSWAFKYYSQLTWLGRPVSGELEWEVKFELEANAQDKWSVVGSHTP